MPGRPRQTLNRVADLTQRAYDLADRVFSAMPPMYQDRENKNDPVGEAWVNAMGAAADAWRALNTLGEVLAEKAGGLKPPRECPWIGNAAAHQQNQGDASEAELNDASDS